MPPSSETRFRISNNSNGTSHTKSRGFTLDIRRLRDHQERSSAFITKTAEVIARIPYGELSPIRKDVSSPRLRRRDKWTCDRHVASASIIIFESYISPISRRGSHFRENPARSYVSLIRFRRVGIGSLFVTFLHIRV